MPSRQAGSECCHSLGDWWVRDPDTADGKMVGIVAEPDAIALVNDGKDGKNWQVFSIE
jgi:hypothetical protein